MEEARGRDRSHDVRHSVLGRVVVFEPSRSSDTRLRGRVRAVGARGCRDGPRVAHENDPSGQQRVGRTRGVDTRQGDQHGQSGQRVTDGRQL